MSKRENRRARGPLPGGIDPSAFLSSQTDRKAERKTRQLCREVRDALGLALSGLEDGTLAGAWVADVLPGADASQLRVVVVSSMQSNADATYQALRRAAGLLRSEVAAAINRKRTPQLSFEVHEEVRP